MSDNRNARLDLRLPAADREAFERAAQTAGDRNVTAWALRMLRLAIATKKQKRTSAT